MGILRVLRSALDSHAVFAHTKRGCRKQCRCSDLNKLKGVASYSGLDLCWFVPFSWSAAKIRLLLLAGDVFSAFVPLIYTKGGKPHSEKTLKGNV